MDITFKNYEFNFIYVDDVFIEQIEFLGMKIDVKGIELQSHILEKIISFLDKLMDKKIGIKFFRNT